MIDLHLFHRAVASRLFFALFLVGSFANLLFLPPHAAAQTWKSLGPYGGDVRALAFSASRPNVVYLGSTDGHVFGSEDGGHRWRLLGLVGAARNSVVTSIVVDPRNADTLLASIWTAEKQGESGGIYRSDDGGRSWRPSGLEGHALRALVMAPSDHDVLVAAALDGVFRSRDAGKSWEMLTPTNDPELRNFDSLAVDPRDPDVIYAGTFHLPWKTTDGGRDWVAIHGGMIDDSDVLSLSLNPLNPDEVFASACSGIYRSEDAGTHWKRVQGIPDSSKRTLVIRFDPASSNILYAGTTDGLWKSTDDGTRWHRVSPADWVINSMLVLPAGDESTSASVLIGTEERGVLLGAVASDDFVPVNKGFQHHRVVSLALDRANPARIGAVLANASDPIIATDDGGRNWSALGSGLDGQSVGRIFSTPDGWWVAMASGGLMRLESNGKWVRAGVLLARIDPPRAAIVSTNSFAKHTGITPLPLRAIVKDLAFGENNWYAATEEGLFRSNDVGRSWTAVSFSAQALPVESVRLSPDAKRIQIVSSRAMLFSEDAGQTWTWHDLPLESRGALRLEIAHPGTLLVTSPTGLWISRDNGASWTMAQEGLPASPISDILVREHFWMVSMENGGLYISRDQGTNWLAIKNPSEVGDPDRFPILQAGFTSERIYAGSAHDGLYLVDLSKRAALAESAGGGH